MENEKNTVAAKIAAKYFSGNVNEDEKEYLGKWINESEENAKYFQQLANIWGTVGTDCESGQIDTARALKEVRKRISGNPAIRRLWIAWGKIAAVLIIPLLAWNSLKLSHKTSENKIFEEPVYNEVFATFGTRTAIKLADSSLVWLNSGSSLRYPVRFAGSQREVYLNGEAYFEVESDPEMPFIVKTNDIVVRATGTKFNILGYNSTSETAVTLVSGKISVSERDGNGRDTLLSDMVPDQHMVFDKNSGALSINNEDPYKHYSWKDGKLIFRNDPLSEVVKKLSQVFNVDIEIQGSDLGDYRYRATFQDESLSDILKLLEISSPIGFKELKRAPMDDGTFPRKKVIIFQLK